MKNHKFMNVKLIILNILFYIIFCQNNDEYEYFTFDEAVNYFNNVKYSQTDYDNIISNLINIFNDYYIYLDIAKNPPPPFKPVDVIKELKSIKTEKITFYEFYQQVFTILLKLQDSHVQIFFKKILELIYISPIVYYTRTINNTNYLFCGIPNIAVVFFNQSFLEEIQQKCNYPIKSINGKEPFDYIQTFGRIQKFKSEQAQFIFNINRFIVMGQYHTYPFIKED